MTPTIRPYRPSDLEAIYRICLLTGDAGRDATPLYSDPRLLGHVYAAPYPIHDAALCFVAELEGAPCGYILGTADSEAFRRWSESHWFPALRARYPLPATHDTSPDAELVRLIHAGYRPPPDLAAYPAHLHVDLLPVLQGQGVGKELMHRFLDALRQRRCPGVHLGVSTENTGAGAFYEKQGFRLLGRHPGWNAYGRTLA